MHCIVPSYHRLIYIIVSDVSLTCLWHAQATTSGPRRIEPESSSAMDGTPPPDDDAVPTVFRWEHGGRAAYITGTFNNWEKQVL
jgi:polyisoprenoid-binding protein YceI